MITEISAALRRVDLDRGGGQRLRHAAQLGAIEATLQAHLAQGAAPQLDHALAERLPVDQEDLDRGAIEAPGAEVLLADRVQIEQALEVEIVHRETGTVRDRGPAVG
jgi:hypothetical protein